MSLDKGKIIENINKKTQKQNIDNISRTVAYATFYQQHKEVKWSFLASMVSRNAGWSMTDLEGIWMRKALDKSIRTQFFYFYEKANWLIFSDAYPQLLMYEWSKRLRSPIFDLLKHFHVSSFMIKEWYHFYSYKDEERLMTSLIINEQHLIDKPVIKQMKKQVINRFHFKLQELFHLSTVIFPTTNGQLYGYSVQDFYRLKKRIELGKKLAAMLFHPQLYVFFYQFSNLTVHTGSRYDFERYLSSSSHKESPMLRAVYPIVPHYIDVKKRNWFHHQLLDHYYTPVHMDNINIITEWYLKKRNQIRVMCLLEEHINHT
ncbi:DUF2515 family protein [Bacillus carboniphilus]|uniref:DUF2515 family protein n=1 Tax=Bacillus carboniphilus TaxID=86663 RepID=A0ABY9K1H7_9BACI|nr:DUF2515 family protein [Bacillus carboniphilus]WLR43700.1 DUF2515 family protein [Bacillus carboniphilus]